MAQQDLTGIRQSISALHGIAELLGTSPEWSSAADFLEDIANIIGWHSPFNHPGDADPDEYREEVNAARDQLIELLDSLEPSSPDES